MSTVASVNLCFSICDTKDENAYSSAKEVSDVSSSVVVIDFYSAREQSSGQ